MNNMAGFWWLVLLFIGFLGVVFYVFRAGARKRYQKDAEILFKDDRNLKPGRKRP